MKNIEWFGKLHLYCAINGYIDGMNKCYPGFKDYYFRCSAIGEQFLQRIIFTNFDDWYEKMIKTIDIKLLMYLQQNKSI